MECLKDWIGIKWKGAEAPDSGVYINQLPGVSLKSIDNLANAEQIDFLGVWDDVQVRSLKRLQTNVTNWFSKRYQLKTIGESLVLPTYFTDGSQNTAASASYRGFTYWLGWIPSPLAAIHVETLRLYLNAPQASLEIKVFEMTNQAIGAEVDSITATDLVAGWNIIKVQKDYNYNKIFVGYDGAAVDSVYMPLQQYFAGGAWWFNFTWGGTYQSPYQAVLKGAIADSPFSTADELNNLYGLSGDISIVCSFDGILCSNKKVFTTCLWYLLGLELMTERIYSDRLNRYTTIDLKRATDLRNEFEKTFQEEMHAAFDGIELTTWDGCLICNAQVQLVHSLP